MTGGDAWRALLKVWQSDRGLSLFLVLLVVVAFVLPALGATEASGRLITNLVFSVLLISGVASVSHRRGVAVVLGVVAATALIARWVSWLAPATDLATGDAWSRLATFGLFAAVALVQVFRDGPVTRHRIEGAVAVYLLLGLAWAGAYELLWLRHPDAFAGAVTGGAPDPQRWQYYSFVTLTTMGYGDITPVHAAARSLAVLEALVGQLYPAILLARLVSLEVEARRRG